MRRTGFLVGIAMLVLGFGVSLCAGQPSPSPEVPVKDTVTMVDVGADKCIPCKMMAPILKELEVEYRGKAAILFVDVWKNPERRKEFNIRAIPTQVFYDKAGKEVSRHEGFLDKDKIVETLEKLGVTK